MNSKWNKVKLGEVLHLHIDAVPVDPTTYYNISGVYSFGRGLLAREPLLGTQTTYKVFNRLHENDFVVSQVKGWEGALARVTAEFDGWFLSPQFPTFRANPDQLDIHYLEWYCRQSHVWETLRRKSRGIGARRETVSPASFLSIEIPLPPLDEQRRIVAQIEALAARIAEARGLRAGALEEAEALLGSAWEVQLQHVSEHVTVIGEISDVRGGIQKSADRIPTSNPRRYLTVAHVQRNQILMDDIRYFEVSDNELERWRLVAGDVLVVEGNGSSEQVGRTALFRGEIEDCVHQNHIIRVRPDPNLVLSEYLNGYLNSPIGQQEMRERSRTSSGLFHLSVERVRSVHVPLPTVELQERIVNYFNTLEAQILNLENVQTTVSYELDALLPSILDRAFRGEL